MTETGFTTMAAPQAAGTAPEIGVGMLGYAFMGKAHSHAFKTLPHMLYPPPAIPRLNTGRIRAIVRHRLRRLVLIEQLGFWCWAAPVWTSMPTRQVRAPRKQRGLQQHLAGQPRILRRGS